MADKIQFRRDTAARWAQFNPVLMEGEVGYVLDDPNQYKIGDGTSPWNSLPMRGFDGTLVHTTGSSTTAVMSQKAVTGTINAIEAQSIYNRHFDLQKPSTDSDYFVNIPFYIHLKAGESVTLSAKNQKATFNGETPYSWAVALKSSDNKYVCIAQSAEDITNTFTATENTYIKSLDINVNVGVETLSLDVSVECGEFIEEFRKIQNNVDVNTKDVSILEAGFTSFETIFYNLEKGGGIETVDFYGSFKAGYPLGIEVEDFVTSGGECNVHIQDADNNSNPVVLYGNGYKYNLLAKDTSHIRLILGYRQEVNTLSAKAKVIYGSAITGINNKVAIQSNADSINKLESLIRDTFSLSIDNISKSFIYDFKKGDVIKFSVSNFSYSGTGAMAFYVHDGTEYIYTLDFASSNNVLDYSTFVVLKRDCSSIKVGISFVDTITAMNADFVVETVPNRMAELRANSKRETGYWHKSLSYGKIIGESILYINYPFKAKELLVLVVSNVKTESLHYSINVSASENIITINNEGYASYVIADDIYKVNISISGIASDFTCDIELLYGEDARKYIRDQNENLLLSAEEEENSVKGTLDDWKYSKKAYVGYKQPFTKDCIIKSLQISSFDATSDNVGKSYNFVIGTIDQRNWLLPRISFTSAVTQVTNNILSFDFSADSIIAKEGEVLFIEMTAIIGSHERVDVLCGLSSDTYNVNNPFMSTNDLSIALSENLEKGCDHYTLKFTPFKSIFAQKDEIESLQSQVNSLQNQLNSEGIYEDSITGVRYQITVSNGNIVLQSLDIKSMLVIGHSFVNYGNSPSVDWYLDDGENRAMAASINEHQWTSLIKDKLGLTTLKLLSGVDFERNYSVNYDFASIWNVDDKYDAICIYLCENALYNDTMQKSWEAMLNYLKSAAPKARIFCTGSWTNNNKQQAIQAACENVSGIVYVNMLPVLSQTANNSSTWHRGDYYYGRERTYYPMGDPAGHPNDKGMLDIANTFLSYMGVQQIEGKTHNITLNQTSGGAIGTPNVEWLENGIVTIRCIPDSGYSIQSVSVQKSGGGSIEVTRRTNNYFDNETERVYYTFTMPNEDVTVTPIWESV